MDHDYQEITGRISRGMSALRQDIPDTMKAFSTLAQAATRAGALDARPRS